MRTHQIWASGKRASKRWAAVKVSSATSEAPLSNIEGHDPPAVVRLDLRAHVLLVENGAAARVLFFVIAGLMHRHGYSRIWRGVASTSVLYTKQKTRATRPVRPFSFTTPSRGERI